MNASIARIDTQLQIDPKIRYYQIVQTTNTPANIYFEMYSIGELYNVPEVPEILNLTCHPALHS